MSEGIIQEVFNPYFSRGNQYTDPILADLQRELMKTIQEKITPYGSDLSRQKIYELLFGET